MPFSKEWRKHGMDFICSGDKTVVAPPRSHQNMQSPNGTFSKNGIVICKFLRKRRAGLPKNRVSPMKLRRWHETLQISPPSTNKFVVVKTHRKV